jgi:ABC-type Fe3+-hydroxamate transport system substrate-binding protein
MRIVSLVPSVTETLLAWGVRPVACTRFCEQPDIAHVGGTKDPDLRAIEALTPDVVIMEREENRREDYDVLRSRGIEVLDLSVRCLDDVNPSMGTLAERVEREWTSVPLGGDVAPRLRAFVPIWRRPYMALGCPTYGSSLLARLGVTNVSQKEGPYPPTTLEQMAARAPDVVLAPSEPYPFTRRQLPELESVAPTVLIDGKDLFWWGTRTPEALVRLGAVISSL